MSQQMVDAFIKNHGTLEDWDGARENYYQALGAFTLGWQARQKAVEQGVQLTAFGVWNGVAFLVGIIVGLLATYFGGN
jgi:hypothetical protein